MDLKQHNLIPEDAQAIVEMYQLREYCILHLAWTRLQQKHASNEETVLHHCWESDYILASEIIWNSFMFRHSVKKL